MLVDKAKFVIRAGKGGNGVVSFRRAKFEPKGGPDGGDGGKGGDVIFKTSKQEADLINYVNKQELKAENGKHGEKSERKGADGEDIILKVPQGTVIYEVINKKEKRLVDLKKLDQEVILAQGGRYGMGNTYFKSSVTQAPRTATEGKLGEIKDLVLKLKLITDIGLIGQPNAGKSTLLSVITRAKPKIANYPFTTLSPNLGVMEHKTHKKIIADIPGLIKDAHQGKGLGIRFLQHIERCQTLVHLVAATEKDVVKTYLEIRNELKSYNKKLIKKPEIIVLNKIDMLTKEEVQKKQKELEKKTNKKIYLISTITKQGVDSLKDSLLS